MECGDVGEPWQGKQVGLDERYVERAGVDEPLRLVFSVTRRTMEANG